MPNESWLYIVFISLLVCLPSAVKSTQSREPQESVKVQCGQVNPDQAGSIVEEGKAIIMTGGKQTVRATKPARPVKPATPDLTVQQS